MRPTHPTTRQLSDKVWTAQWGDLYVAHWFVAAAIRSAAVGLQLLEKNRGEVRAFEAQAPAADWLLSRRDPALP